MKRNLKAEVADRLYKKYLKAITEKKGEILSEEEKAQEAIRRMYSDILKQTEQNLQEDTPTKVLMNQLDAINVDYEKITALAEKTLKDDPQCKRSQT